VADQLYASYARGRDLRQLVTVIGEAALSPAERRLLEFADRFEADVVGQAGARRSLDESFAVAWRCLGRLPRATLTRIPEAVLEAEWRPIEDADEAMAGATLPSAAGSGEGRSVT
jgi:V/A-type H+-transporting ATPase subunit B